jgi:hypothetical protein
MKAPGAYPAKKMKRRLGEEPNKGLMEFVCGSIPRNHTIIDIGAGEGRHVRELCRLGYSVCGIDGCEEVEEITEGTVKWCDLSDPNTLLVEKSDWGLFIEVGEHIPREHEKVVLDNVCSMVKDGLIVSWAVPGQRGHHHVNCRMPVYIASQFALRGFVVNDTLTQRLAELMGRKSRYKVMVLRRV